MAVRGPRNSALWNQMAVRDASNSVSRRAVAVAAQPFATVVGVIELPLDLEFGTDAQRHRYYVVDAFTDTALAGNQLGVFADARALSAQDMQRLARELNFAEPVFVLPPEQEGDVRIRIFTPSTELAFAGHPVLGTAFLVGAALGGDAVRLETGLGSSRSSSNGPSGDRVRSHGAAGRDLATLRTRGRAARRARGRRLRAPGRGVPKRAAARLRRSGRRGGGDEIEIRQGTEIARPSTLYARATGTAEGIEQVQVGGAAVVVARGEFRLPGWPRSGSR